MKRIMAVALATFVMAFFVAVTYVGAQTATPEGNQGSPTPTPTTAQDQDTTEDTTPEGAPRTGFGG